LLSFFFFRFGSTTNACLFPPVTYLLGESSNFIVLSNNKNYWIRWISQWASCLLIQITRLVAEHFIKKTIRASNIVCSKTRHSVNHIKLQETWSIHWELNNRNSNSRYLHSFYLDFLRRSNKKFEKRRVKAVVTIEFISWRRVDQHDMFLTIKKKCADAMTYCKTSKRIRKVWLSANYSRHHEKPSKIWSRNLKYPRLCSICTRGHYVTAVIPVLYHRNQAQRGYFS